jgi:hypothetical protein
MTKVKVDYELKISNFVTLFPAEILFEPLLSSSDPHSQISALKLLGYLHQHNDSLSEQLLNSYMPTTLSLLLTTLSEATLHLDQSRNLLTCEITRLSLWLLANIFSSRKVAEEFSTTNDFKLFVKLLKEVNKHADHTLKDAQREGVSCICLLVM